MPRVTFFDQDVNNAWIVHRFEAYRYCGTGAVDKVIPRPFVFIVFRFQDRPAILEQIEMVLDPLFVAPIVPHSVNLKFQGTMDTLVIVCKASVFSRFFEVDLSPVPQRGIPLVQTVFRPLWSEMATLSTTAERVMLFSDFLNSLQSHPYQVDAVDMFYDKIIE